ncbi:hypothetical protein E3226_001510 [Legionella geestiana]|uniref:iron-sulfur cluster assembly scaffold protein n=1 Tax=Legionella geestiana TaxID=45065 RepID=UPI001091BA57|nr:iron-sulfur cluster assembly scaffold protein [Legionella geestiana]QDQ39176.1 hypothetical protein E3226_001510 [Legionella geestiana]
MTYNKLTESCFFEARHAGTLKEGAPNLVYHRSGQAGFGDVIDLYLACDAQGGVVAARFQASGNPWLIAACEWMCARFEAQGIAAVAEIDYQTLIENFDIPRARYPVALQVEDAFKAIISEMRTRLEKKNHD